MAEFSIGPYISYTAVVVGGFHEARDLFRCTWGFNPADGSRFPFPVRWTGVFQQTLGSAVRVIEEGLNDRTTSFDDPTWDGRNGRKALPMLLDSHRPLDLSVIMLGTNDVKVQYQLTPFAIAKGAEALVDLCTTSQAGPDGTPPKVLLVSPAYLAATENRQKILAFEGAAEKLRDLPLHLREVVEEFSCYFFEAAGHVHSSPQDGIHWEAADHRAFGLAVAQEIDRILGLSAEKCWSIPV